MADIVIASEREEGFVLCSQKGDIYYLNNLYSNWLHDEIEGRLERVLSFVRGQTEPHEVPDTYEEAIMSLRPVLKGDAHASLIHLLTQADLCDSHWLASRTVLPGVSGMVGFDGELVMTFVSTKQLATWGVDFDVVWKAAVANLHKQSGVDGWQWDGDGKVLRARWSDGYDVSRLLVTEAFESMRFVGNPVAFLPSRDELWICSSNDIATLRVLVEESNEMHFGAYPILGTPLIFQNGVWQTFAPSDLQLAIRIARTQQRRLAVDYEEQKQSLIKLTNRQGRDVFIAKCTLYEHNVDERYWTSCVWPNGVPTLLPQTVTVVLFIATAPRESLTVKWDDLVAVVGCRMKEERGLVPKRYFVDSFPSQDELMSLRLCAIEET